MEAQCDVLQGFFASLRDDEWRRATRCPPLDVRSLTAHLVTQLEHVASLRDKPASVGEPERDRISWWHYDIEEDQRETLEATLRAAELLPGGAPAAVFAAAAKDAVDACRARLSEGDPLVLDRPILLSEFVATRVLELTIHGMDLADGVGREMAPAGEAMAVTGDILRALLGADLRPAVTDERLAIIGTGRGMPTAEEAAALGPATEKFPLLA